MSPLSSFCLRSFLLRCRLLCRQAFCCCSLHSNRHVLQVLRGTGGGETQPLSLQSQEAGPCYSQRRCFPKLLDRKNHQGPCKKKKKMQLPGPQTSICKLRGMEHGKAILHNNLAAPPVLHGCCIYMDTHATMWMTLENHYAKWMELVIKDLHCMTLYEMTRMNKSIKTKRRLVVGRVGNDCLMDLGFSFGEMEMFWN